MTVAVGFMCTDGIVLAADREVSTPGVKYDGPKAWVYRYPRDTAVEPTVRIGLVGAGDYAFIKFASERLDRQIAEWIDIHGVASMEEINDAIDVVLQDIHRHHLYPVGRPHERPTIDLLIGIWLKGGRIRLARTSLTAVTKVWNYEAVGIGSDLANFLVRRAYAGRIPMSSAMFWATYVLMHAKHYVPGCGSGSDVIAMFNSGAGVVKRDTIAKYEQFARDFENAIHPVFLSGADESVQQEMFMRQVDELTAKLKTLRDPLFIQKQAEEIQRDVSIRIPTGHMEITGSWILGREAERQETEKSTSRKQED